MELTPYLIFNGNCSEAFKFYEKCLGGQIEMLKTYGDSPVKEQVPPRRDKVIHVRLEVGNVRADGFGRAAERFEPPQGTMVSFMVDEVAGANASSTQLSAGGKIRCRSKRRSGPRASAWRSTASARRGW